MVNDGKVAESVPLFPRLRLLLRPSPSVNVAPGGKLALYTRTTSLIDVAEVVMGK